KAALLLRVAGATIPRSVRARAETPRRHRRTDVADPGDAAGQRLLSSRVRQHARGRPPTRQPWPCASEWTQSQYPLVRFESERCGRDQELECGAPVGDKEPGDRDQSGGAGLVDAR